VSPRVHFVGAGPGDPELLTVKAARLIAKADLLLYPGSLVPEAVVKLAKPQARLLDTAPLTLEQTHAAIMEAVSQNLAVVRLQAGDPGLYGTVGEQARLLAEAKVAYAVVPGITAASAAAAAFKVPVTVPGGTQTLILTRQEGRTAVPQAEAIGELARHQASMAVYLSAGDPETLRAGLLAGGYAPDTPVAVAHRLGWPDEQLHWSSLGEFPELVRNQGITRQTVFLVLPGLGLATRSKLYHPDFTHSFRGQPSE